MKILLPFVDDSTLFFSASLKENLEKMGVNVDTCYVDSNGLRGEVSERQMHAILGQGPSFTADLSIYTDRSMRPYDAVVVSRVPPELSELVQNESYMTEKNRPCYVGFKGGLEFTPISGIKNRQGLDVIYLANQNHFDSFRYEKAILPRTKVLWGHPYFLKPVSAPQTKTNNIYFFAQAVSPSTYNGRMHLVEVLNAIALANPTKNVYIKLRHLPGENAKHKHVEKFDYPALVSDLCYRQPNIYITSEPMSRALAKAGIAITCTSTAAMETISSGIPTMVYLDYVECYRDPLVVKMRDCFEQSGLVTDLNGLLNLETKAPRQAWIDSHFRESDLFSELVGLIQKHKCMHVRVSPGH